ncbi:MAG: hypothetical protein NTY41_11400, partial [Proteobacteria bacterium]|nr:hypothetical protein [Pseudomonadota bacterium]
WDVYGRYAGKDGYLASSKFAINTDAGNQMGGITCAGGKCLALISSGVRLGDGMEQVGEVYGAFLTAQQMSPLALVAGWNLVGNSVDAAITVTTSFSDTNKVASVWKWVTSGTTSGVTYPTWAFYSPLQSDDGVAYARNEGYEFLTTINAGEGYWLNANAAFTAQLPSGTAIASTTFRGMSSGWHLIATGDTTTPSQFNSDLSVISPAAGETPRNVTSLWAWDSAQSKWYFYAPRLAAEGGSTLSNFITSNGYLNFTTASKTLGSGIGFWVNTP